MRQVPLLKEPFSINNKEKSGHSDHQAMGMKTKYWTGIDELHGTPAAQEALTSEFKKDQSVENFLSDSKLKDTNTGRRDFLKFMGFSVA
ncbi:MAG: TAT-variant-translocated molybdopterin oxidoreductase, partial [Flavobacteriales bacterium]